jgi:hypothetical protein
MSGLIPKPNRSWFRPCQLCKVHLDGATESTLKARLAATFCRMARLFGA